MIFHSNLMHTQVVLNGQVLGPAEAKIRAVSSAAFYGRGVFTTVAIRSGAAFLWEKHWRRLASDAERMGLDIAAHSEAATRRSLAKLTELNGVRNGRARATLFDETSGSLWQSTGEGRTSCLITTGDRRESTEEFGVAISPFLINSRAPLTGIKSCNYLERLMAFEAAKKGGADESIQLNENGVATSACLANIFWLAAGVLYTPSIATGCIPGTTREYVLENLECREVELGIESLRIAESIFLTSAGLGIKQVSEFDRRKLLKTQHPILSLIK